jgi:hypothetical protein
MAEVCFRLVLRLQQAEAHSAPACRSAFKAETIRSAIEPLLRSRLEIVLIMSAAISEPSSWLATRPWMNGRSVIR